MATGKKSAKLLLEVPSRRKPDPEANKSEADDTRIGSAILSAARRLFVPFWHGENAQPNN
jgi:hypothetical protein